MAETDAQRRARVKAEMGFEPSYVQDENTDNPTGSEKPLPGQNSYISRKGDRAFSDTSAGAGRGKKYAKGGSVKSFKGYGKARKV